MFDSMADLSLRDELIAVDVVVCCRLGRSWPFRQGSLDARPKGSKKTASKMSSKRAFSASEYSIHDAIVVVQIDAAVVVAAAEAAFASKTVIP